MPRKTANGPKRVDGPNAMRRTSIQLPKDTVKELSSIRGLSFSEALRLRLERYDWLMQASKPRAAGLVDVYRDTLRAALANLGVGDYVIVARALPELIGGYMVEHGLEDDALLTMLRSLTPAGRLQVLDLVQEG